MSKVSEALSEQREMLGDESDCDGRYFLPGETPNNVSSLQAAQFKQQVKSLLPSWCKVSIEVTDGGLHAITAVIGSMRCGPTIIEDYSDAGVQRIKKSYAIPLAMGNSEREKSAAARVIGSDINSVSRSVKGDRGWFSD